MKSRQRMKGDAGGPKQAIRESGRKREREKERMVERHRGSYINEVGQRGGDGYRERERAI